MGTLSDKLVAAGLDDLTAARMETETGVELAEARRQQASAQTSADFWTAELTKWTAEVQRLEGALAIKGVNTP